MMSPFLPTRSTSARRITLTRSPSLDLCLLELVGLAVGPSGQLLDEDLTALLTVGADLDGLGLGCLEVRDLRRLRATAPAAARPPALAHRALGVRQQRQLAGGL